MIPIYAIILLILFGLLISEYQVSSNKQKNFKLKKFNEIVAYNNLKDAEKILQIAIKNHTRSIFFGNEEPKEPTKMNIFTNKINHGDQFTENGFEICELNQNKILARSYNLKNFFYSRIDLTNMTRTYNLNEVRQLKKNSVYFRNEDFDKICYSFYKNMKTTNKLIHCTENTCCDNHNGFDFFYHYRTIISNSRLKHLNINQIIFGKDKMLLVDAHSNLYFFKSNVTDHTIKDELLTITSECFLKINDNFINNGHFLIPDTTASIYFCSDYAKYKYLASEFPMIIPETCLDEKLTDLCDFFNGSINFDQLTRVNRAKRFECERNKNN